MHYHKQFLLKPINSFNFSSITDYIYYPASEDDLQLLPNLSHLNFYILGDGTNTLFINDKAPIIIRSNFKGIFVQEDIDTFTVTVGSGENWHELVCFCLERNINGLENLALIPGSVGAAPVQNIGAYGAEFSDFCVSVQWYDLLNRKIKTILKDDCNFGYRESIFKQKLRNKGLITQVTLSFPKVWSAKKNYGGLNELPFDVSAKDLMDKVISLREQKLPDPTVLPNAGSFFKNPIVTKVEAEKLLAIYPKMPFYTFKYSTDIKLAAGWLIENAGLKGFCYKNVGVHKNQALVLVNYNAQFGDEIISLAKYVQQQVKIKFNVFISPEVRMVNSLGEINFADIVEYEKIQVNCND